MKWYTLKWQHVSEGCQVEHFLTKEMAERRQNEIKQLSSYDDELNEVSAFDHSYGITRNVVKNGRELIDWLNNNYTTENG